ncbi:hypothetical protein K469DRAFT_596091 [Zopfia rhizophila CBS 207.26]|uniref:Uncharacterized protein n=1 Tax=Zopfia rhizophila CBS 207.26 TaxID=1314779 RepID=A0A6A6DJR4_9PEZI|nr:hypothetical protein K469DRAFT_596091 [Zopfia rhizophila CBS 207.26]
MPSVYRAPSWSWASLDGGIQFERFKNVGRPENVLFHAILLEVHITPLSSDLFGAVLGGHVLLSGRPRRIHHITSGHEHPDNHFA